MIPLKLFFSGTVSEYPDCAVFQSASLDARIIGYAQQQDIVMIMQQAIMVKGAMKNAVQTVIHFSVSNQQDNAVHVREVLGELLALSHVPTVLMCAIKPLVNVHHVR